MTRPIISVALAFAMSAAVVSPTLAQNADGPRGMMGMMGGGCPTIGMMGHGMMGGWGQGGWGRGMMGRQPRMGAVVGGRLAYLKGELEITAAQTEAWDAYAAAVEARVELMQSLHQSMVETMQAGTATERMDARIASMEAMLESMKAMKPATEGLYAVLDENQKKVADELIGADCGAM
ncbi:MAG: Spy/CpxP family protein refolding chaperone [Mesorhizobium sp.]|nr:Spy/CpxP family protein refolding chaperone [Mesorhizobium sp.]